MKGWTHVEGKEITDENNDEVGPITIHKHKYVSPQPCGLSLTKNTHPSEKNKTFGTICKWH